MNKECLRMCVVCRCHKPKGELSRFIIDNDTVKEDKTKKYNARGFYICKNQDCIEKAIKGKSISKILDRRLTEIEIKEIISSISK